jgi:hypothetical protein
MVWVLELRTKVEAEDSRSNPKYPDDKDGCINGKNAAITGCALLFYYFNA